MGFTRCVLPSRNVPKDATGIELVGVDSVDEALGRLFE
jgi:hypothetical protein